MAHGLCQILLKHVESLSEQITALEMGPRVRARQDAVASRLMTILGIGAICAPAIEALAPWQKPQAARFCGLAWQMGRQVSKLTGWGEENIERTLTYFRLPLAHRKHMNRRTCWSVSTRRSDGAPMWCSSPERRELFKAGAGADCRASRGVARGPSLSQHESVEGAQEEGVTPHGLTMLRSTKGERPSPPQSLAALRFWASVRHGSGGMARPEPMIEFAELDAQNWCDRRRAMGKALWIASRIRVDSKNNAQSWLTPAQPT